MAIVSQALGSRKGELERFFLLFTWLKLNIEVDG
jgi:hypothetical protein